MGTFLVSKTPNNTHELFRKTLSFPGTKPTVSPEPPLIRDVKPFFKLDIKNLALPSYESP